MRQAINQFVRQAGVRAGAKRINAIKACAVVFGAGGFCVVLGWSAAVAFERHTPPVPLAATDRPQTPRLGQRPAPSADFVAPIREYEEVGVNPPAAHRDARVRAPRPVTDRSLTPQPRVQTAAPAGVKFDRFGNLIMVNGKPWTGEVFDHRPIRPVKTRTMKTTAYSPDEKSCGKWADGITASGKSVWMNGGRLVAADRKIPYGTILTIPGYNGGKPVQVWDRGGKIKGNRLDLLYPTHEIALQWGVQDLPVVFWEFVETD
ncbi:MAG: 3D domain-containing protein [Phycisphaeraceae bacterium]